MHKKEKNLFFTKNGSTGLKIGKFWKRLSFSRTRERKTAFEINAILEP
jgi:hypothetical protein